MLIETALGARGVSIATPPDKVAQLLDTLPDKVRGHYEKRRDANEREGA